MVISSHHIRVGNNSAYKIVDIINASLKTNKLYRFLFKDVRHILNIRLTSICTRKLDEKGYINNFEGQWKLTKGSLVVTKGKKLNTLPDDAIQFFFNGKINASEDSSIKI